jgi:CubicO group peptidase (beta-lactamase class C family)
MLASEVPRGFGGVARIYRHGSLILSTGYGTARRDPDRGFTPVTVVQIGSGTKDFTTVAILQLVERGRLTLDDSLGRFVPEAPADKRRITIRQLIRHRAGFSPGLPPDSQLITRDDFVRRAMAQQLAFAPGEREQYSNVGYSLLALIIERQSGMSYDAFVDANILQPLGLKNLGYHLPRFAPERVAVGQRDGVQIRSLLEFPHPADGPSWTLRGNGGMLGTMEDITTFYQALFNTERLLRSATRDIVFDPRSAIVLAGSDRVNYFVYRREPQHGVEIFLATNSTAVPATAVMPRIAAALGLGAGRQVVTTSPSVASIPDTPVGRTVREYFDMFNKGDTAAARVFFAERFVPDPNAPPTIRRVERARDMRMNFGTVTPVSYREPSPGEVFVEARTNEGLAMFEFVIETSAPYRVRRLGIRIGD